MELRPAAVAMVPRMKKTGNNQEEGKGMKRSMISIRTVAALLLTVAAVTACSNDDIFADESTPVTTREHGRSPLKGILSMPRGRLAKR